MWILYFLQMPGKVVAVSNLYLHLNLFLLSAFPSKFYHNQTRGEASHRVVLQKDIPLYKSIIRIGQ